MGNGIVAVHEVHALYGCRSMESARHITEQARRDHSVSSLRAAFGKLLHRDYVFLERSVHHALGKHKLVKPIVISLEKAYSPHLADIYVSEYLL
jgi:hypothetical protein